MMMVVGTSSVMLALSDREYSKNGVVSGVRGAVFPGSYVLESGIAAVGDMLGWFVDHMVPETYLKKQKNAEKIFTLIFQIKHTNQFPEKVD